ncbi:hypothetical protein ABC347_10960 [Sphingomonas sp. 1P06PA]|uniref:hypothetical protein n=1 Tax=Sphingomonas sp. 1P06PA TaxID=554121 RepID=UPI0039A5D106
MSNALIVKPLAGIATASATSLGTAANVLNDYAGVIWRSPTGTDFHLRIDFGADVAFDTVMLFGLIGPPTDALLDIKIATAAQGFFTGAFYTAPQMSVWAGTVRQANGLGVTLWQAPAGAPTVARYLQIRVINLAGSYVQVARAVVGKRLALARNYSVGGAFGVRDLGTTDFGVLGTLLRRRGAKLRSIGINFEYVFRDEAEAQVQPLIELAGASEPIALVTDPDPHANRERRAYFGPLVSDLGTVQRVPNGFGWAASVVDLFPVMPA